MSEGPRRRLNLLTILGLGITTAGIAMIALAPAEERLPNDAPGPPHFAHRPTLTQVDCDQERSLRSPGDEATASIEFVNQRSKSTRIYRLDPTGNREHIDVLPPYRSSEYLGYVNDAWLVATEEDYCLSIFIPREAQGTAVISSSAPSQAASTDGWQTASFIVTAAGLVVAILSWVVPNPRKA
jgi:hypothetical protein